MTTYNTFAEAKIANPESEIVRWNKSDEYKAVSKSDLSGYLTTWSYCNPADYCITVEQFLKDGHKFVEGDKYIHSRMESVLTVGHGFSVDESNDVHGDDGNCYILRAAALEQPKQEVEWKNGDELVWMNGNREFLSENTGRYICFDDVSGYHIFVRTNVEKYKVSYSLSDGIQKPKTDRELVIEQAEKLTSEYGNPLIAELYALGMLKPIQEG
ncbi:hypothetical protein pA_gene0020 [Vibrio phage 13VT501A]|nr:hypothetical protein pA_gene0020 [Vibrio phage 13VT501A]